MKNILYIVILAVFATSCDDWLDLQPKGKVIPSKVEDYRLLLDETQGRGEGSVIAAPDIDLWLTDDIDLRDDFIGRNYSKYQTNAFTFEDHFYLPSEEDESMGSVYASIYIFNTIIDEVLATDGDEDEKIKLYSEAKAHRAFAYLKLVNIYAKQYDATTAETDLGLPLRLVAILEGSLKRGSVADVYELILNDLTEAYDGLPETQVEFWRPSKASVNAILARTHLIMGDFDMALNYADEALGMYSELTDFNSLYPHYWYTHILDFGQRYQYKEQFLLKAPPSDYITIYPSQEFMDLFDQTNDLRFTGKISPEWTFPETRLQWYHNAIGGAAYGVTVPEMILTRAECNARKGDSGVSAAMDDINLLRQNRIATAAYVPLTAANAAEALAIVKKERRMELAFMGHRFTDIRRYNAYDDANISIVHTVEAETYTLAPGDNKWVVPFAEKYILKNPEIEQNPR
ncbi:RagB/SusD family nutrient uptake outer membrane protein [Ancylomarina sp. 16SWW S1-10-2]|uniref:RagB/SusD family nutrient uptake outer membrane protein n=1 Tax=Ancylomarina sp. 16SWW S1-10-2 TaxID=2499681 RepID=UPI00189CD4AA|nr:RagB/SusD family nutrient uptake outer membrane protein [Ancylomarina sp. 16SWW S1-10-2]